MVIVVGLVILLRGVRSVTTGTIITTFEVK